MFRSAAVTAAIGGLMLSLGACRDSGEPLSTHAHFYVAPNGTPQGDGTVAHPWDFATALAHPGSVQPEDTILVRGGTYKGQFLSTLAGGAGHLIVVRGLPTERAIIDGSLEVRGQYTEYWGLEVMNSDPDRDSDQPGPSPSDYARPVGVVVHGPGTKLINMVVHDARSGIGCWSTAVDAEIYGTIVYNNGWQGPDDGYGAGIMSQNKEGTKTFADNVVFQQYKGGLEVYGSSDADLVGFHLDGNVAFLNGTLSTRPSGWDIFVGGGKKADRIVASNNFTYRRDGHLSVRFGYDPGTPNEEASLTDNYFVGETEIINWNKLTMKGNTFTGAQDLLIVRALGAQQFRKYNWNNNTYVADTTIATGGSDQPLQLFQETTRGAFDLVAWRKMSGLDGSSHATRGKPVGTKVFVRPNKYEKGRAHIIVYNWDHEKAVGVDLSKILKAGDHYEIRSVQDLYGKVVAEGVFGGGFHIPFLHGNDVKVALEPIPPATPVGLTKSIAPTTAPEFAVFLVTVRDPNATTAGAATAGATKLGAVAK